MKESEYINDLIEDKFLIANISWNPRVNVLAPVVTKSIQHIKETVH